MIDGTDTRTQIMRAFADQLAATGYSGISLVGVADDVGIRKPSIYHHFPGGKAELVAVDARHALPVPEGVDLRSVIGPGGLECRRVGPLGPPGENGTANQRSCFWPVRRLHRGQPDAGGIEERSNLLLVIAIVGVVGRGELLAADVI